MPFLFYKPPPKERLTRSTPSPQDQKPPIRIRWTPSHFSSTPDFWSTQQIVTVILVAILLISLFMLFNLRLLP